jgi:EAL domain-containing protein (putative c-di-GMP-specific phosphodiesterase class I)
MLAQATWTQNDVLKRLRELGCKISIDNFGMEYSSFEYLRSYSINKLKIDQTFINLALKDKEWNVAIQAIIHLAKELGIGVIAEGIENIEQESLFSTTKDKTCAQGFYYSTPVAKEDMTKLLKKGYVKSGRKRSLQKELE